MDLELRGRVALVAGAGRGIGAACARRLAQEGARVGLLARTTEQLEGLAKTIAAQGGQAMALPCDARDSKAVGDALTRLEDAWGPPLVLVACHAAHFSPAKLHTLTEE